MQKKTIVLAIFVLSFMVMCQTVGAKENENTIVVAQVSSNTCLDYAMGSTTEVQNLSNNIFDTLVRINRNLELEASVAKSWENPDNLTWVFHLRKGIKFSNGDPLDAKAVKYTLERVMDPKVKSPQRWRLKNVKEIQTPDTETVIIKTKKPYASLGNILTLMFIVPPKVVERMGHTKFAQNPIGSGPFVVESFLLGGDIVLKANKDYWRGAPKIDKVIFRPIKETSTRIAALKTGEIDIASSIPPIRFKELIADPNIRLTSKSGVMLYMGLNTFKPPLDSVKVRQAINYAMDIDIICDKIFLGAAQPMAGPVFRVTNGFNKNIKPYPHDPEKAKKLLGEAGYENGFEIILTTRQHGIEGTTNVLEVSQAIAAQLEEVGIKVKLRMVDPATNWKDYKAGKFDAYMMTWDTQVEPDRYLYSLFHSVARGYYYKNQKVDDLLSKGRSTMGWTNREPIYNEVHEVLYTDSPWGFLYNQKNYYGVRSNVKWEASPDGVIHLYDAEKVMTQ